MIRNLTLTCCMLLALFFSGRAQDIHFTLYDVMPLAFNPAETGAFRGTYRLSAIYRDQWLSVTGVGNEFKTPSLSVDVPVIKGFRDNDWVGVGVLLYTDKSGSLGLTQSSLKISAAYHLALDKKGMSILSFAYQTGGVQKRIKDVSKLITNQDQEFLLEDDQTFSELKASYTEQGGGIHLKTHVNKTDLFQLGVSVGHIGKPKGELDGSGGGGGSGQGFGRYEVPMRILGHGSYRRLVNDRLAIVPSAMIQVLGKDSEIQGQVVGEYLFNPEKQIVLKGGLGYRAGDALQVILGTNIRELQVTAGYDINISRLTPASDTFGAFEISASIIGIIYKKPDPDPVLFCPRF